MFSTNRMANEQPLNTTDTSLDCLVVGAGFGGIYTLYCLRKLGYSVKIFECSADIGGIWYSNCYPGARVDSEVPVYEYSLEEVWRDWTWSEKFPGRDELRRYFNHVDKKLDIRKDVLLNKRVVKARFNTETDHWTVTAEDGTAVQARFLVLCTGFASKIYIPKLKGLDSFQGISHHTAHWPQEGVELKGKRVGVVGTGASGVQVIQETAADVKHLTVFQRTPNYALPMMQTKLDKESQDKMKPLYPAIFQYRRETVNGHRYDKLSKKVFEATPSERILHFENMWSMGGFHFAIENYADFITDQASNDELYEFWKRKVRERLHDHSMQEKLAPSISPHPLGAKRMSLEQTYYEVYNRSNVELIDLNQFPINEITPQGVLTADGVEHELDVLILATGFDSHTGGITQIDICDVEGKSIKDKWADGVATNLGLTTAGFPNMFFMYGPQSPTAFSNAPTQTDIQGEWIINCIEHMSSNGFTRIDAQVEAEQEWRNKVLAFGSMTLVPKARGWYMGSNVEGQSAFLQMIYHGFKLIKSHAGKAVEPYNFMGGVDVYDKSITECAAQGYVGFTLT
ncbi:FAD dependent oxidoreductase [Rhodocollybia butyracea]|uniref:FAD dependent oxidoreductase n=1 Tax=Rhodocollybia butyracea TaxID=206335 RepID=A0A9P5PSE7_9AGAR|nr:FAD dependent oxidoreductase [Rhodocollybia butyracea]